MPYRHEIDLDAKRLRCIEVTSLSEVILDSSILAVCIAVVIVGWAYLPNSETYFMQENVRSTPLSRISNARMCLQRSATCPLGELSSTIYENNGNKRHSEALLSRKNPANINTIKSKGEINMNKSTVKPSCLASKKAAFTLAEVLISLGIIGIVAALTLPAIISNYKKSVIETSVKKFYTNINQAIIMSERENGDRHDWSRTAYYDDGASTWDTYFDKYVITIKRAKTRDGKNTIFVFF